MLRPLVGWALDRYRRKCFLVASLIIYVIAMLLFAVASNITALSLARIVQRISMNFFGMGLLPIGALIGGALDSTIGVQGGLFVGAGCMSTAFLWLLFSPLRRQRSLSILKIHPTNMR